MTYGNRFGSFGEMRVDEVYFLRKHSSQFGKMLKYARQADRDTGSSTVHEWEIAALKLQQETKDDAAAELKLYNADCETICKKFDDSGKTFEQKRTVLRKMEKVLRARKQKFETRLRVLEREYKRFGRIAETARRYSHEKTDT